MAGAHCNSERYPCADAVTQGHYCLWVFTSPSCCIYTCAHVYVGALLLRVIMAYWLTLTFTDYVYISNHHIYFAQYTSWIYFTFSLTAKGLSMALVFRGPLNTLWPGCSWLSGWFLQTSGVGVFVPLEGGGAGTVPRRLLFSETPHVRCFCGRRRGSRWRRDRACCLVFSTCPALLKYINKKLS